MIDTFDVKAVTSAKVTNDVVTQTLDTLNSGVYSGSGVKNSAAANKMSNTYNLSKSVLSAAYEGKGIAVSLKG